LAVSAANFYLGRTSSAVGRLFLLLFGTLLLFMGWFALGICGLVDAFLIRHDPRR
jgi:hypothetical protein